MRDILIAAANRLQAAGAHDEALAQFVPPRRVMVLFTKDASFVPIGRVWRLGVFLLDADGVLFETGSTTRAVPPGYPGYQSVSTEHRRDYRAAAFRGPFARGETVNFDAAEIDLSPESLRSSTGPLFLRGDTAVVRWMATARADTAVELGAYLAERVTLLIDRPAES